MSVFFGRLFDLIVKRGITQEELCRACNISLKTFADMKRGISPSIEVLDSICDYLDCGFNDIMEHVRKEGYEPLIDKQIERNLTQGCSIFRVALKEYMKNTNCTIVEISQTSGLSINTINNLLVGKIISSASCMRLLAISKEFRVLVEEKNRLFNEGVELENSSVVIARNKIEKFAGNSDTVALLKNAVIDYMQKNCLDSKSYAEQIGIKVVTLENLIGGKAVIYTVLRKVLDTLSDKTIIEIAENIDETQPIVSLSTKFRPRNCTKCVAYDKDYKECRLLYKIEQKDSEYYSAEPCSKPRTFTAVYEEGRARNIQFKKRNNVEFYPEKLNRWDN